MRVQTSGLSDPGRVRKNNEDFHLLDEELRLAVLCDGVSGNAGGRTAAEICAKTIHSVFRENTALLAGYGRKPSLEIRNRIAALMRDAVQKASAAIYDAAEKDSSKKGMSTTLDAVLFLDDRAILAHVGDSRTYLLRAGQVHRLTEDHKMAIEMVKKGLWKMEEAAKSPYRNVLTRAVGIQRFIDVDLLQCELQTGDTVILCSDGLSNYVDGDELVQLATHHESSVLPGELIKVANSRGGKDNITVIVSQVLSGTAANAPVNARKKSDVLGKIPLFRYLDFAELNKILNLADTLDLGTGQTLVEEGSVAEEMFVIMSGKAEVVKEGESIAAMGAGDFFGEMGILDSSPRSASVRSAEAARLLRIRRTDLMAVLREDQLLAVKFLWALSLELNRRLRATSKDLAEARSIIKARDADLPF